MRTLRRQRAHRLDDARWRFAEQALVFLTLRQTPVEFDLGLVWAVQVLGLGGHRHPHGSLGLQHQRTRLAPHRGHLVDEACACRQAGGAPSRTARDFLTRKCARTCARENDQSTATKQAS